MEITIGANTPPEEVGRKILDIQNAAMDIASIGAGRWRATIHHNDNPLASFTLPRTFKADTHDQAQKQALAFIYLAGLQPAKANATRSRLH